MSIYSDLVKETILGILYRTFLWSAGVPSWSASRGSRKRSYYDSDNISGLSIVLGIENEMPRNERRRITHSCKASAENILLPSSFCAWLPSESSSSWTSSTTGDLIGTESGVHMIGSKDAEQWENPQPSTTCGQSSRVKEEKKRDFPPPITLLRGRGDCTGPRSWFLKREYVDRRLLLKATTVEYFENFEATRVDGRLRMNLVTVDNSANCSQINEEDTDENIEEDDYEQTCTENGDERYEHDEEKSLLVLDDMYLNGMPISLAASLPELITMEKEMKNVDTLRKCVTYTEGMATLNFLDSSYYSLQQDCFM